MSLELKTGQDRALHYIRRAILTITIGQSCSDLKTQPK